MSTTSLSAKRAISLFIVCAGKIYNQTSGRIADLPLILDSIIAQTSVEYNLLCIALGLQVLALSDIVLVVLEMVLESTATSEGSVSPRVIADQLGSHLRTPSPFQV